MTTLNDLIKMSFFSKENGISQSSANFTTNVAKEMYSKHETFLKNVSFHDITVEVVGKTGQSFIQVAHTKEDLESIPDRLRKVSNFKSLCAWIREAQKEIERAKMRINNLSFVDYSNGRLPEVKNLESMDQMDYFTTVLTREQYQRYLYLDTQCAVIGSQIHPGGKLHKEKSDHELMLSNPINMDAKDPSNILIYRSSSTMSSSEIDALYFPLQEKYRKYQKELNAMKYQMEQYIANYNEAEKERYNTEQRKYNAERELLQVEFSKLKDSLRQEVNSLLICIPANLTEALAEVNAVAG